MMMMMRRRRRRRRRRSWLTRTRTPPKEIGAAQTDAGVCAPAYRKQQPEQPGQDGMWAGWG
jgi:hypothetical protein